MAWGDKLLIKGPAHSAAEYLVAGKAAQPAQERALLRKSRLPGSALRQRAAGVGWGAGICAPSGHKGPGKGGVRGGNASGEAVLCSWMPAQGCCRTEPLASCRKKSLCDWCQAGTRCHLRGKGATCLMSCAPRCCSCPSWGYGAGVEHNLCHGARPGAAALLPRSPGKARKRWGGSQQVGGSLPGTSMALQCQNA